jgi:hypothetical protein
MHTKTIHHSTKSNFLGNSNSHTHRAEKTRRTRSRHWVNARRLRRCRAEVAPHAGRAQRRHGRQIGAGAVRSNGTRRAVGSILQLCARAVRPRGTRSRQCASRRTIVSNRARKRAVGNIANAGTVKARAAKTARRHADRRIESSGRAQRAQRRRPGKTEGTRRALIAAKCSAANRARRIRAGRAVKARIARSDRRREAALIAVIAGRARQAVANRRATRGRGKGAKRTGGRADGGRLAIRAGRTFRVGRVGHGGAAANAEEARAAKAARRRQTAGAAKHGRRASHARRLRREISRI